MFVTPSRLAVVVVSAALVLCFVGVAWCAPIDVSAKVKSMTMRQRIGQTFLPFINPNLIPERDRLITYYNQGYGAGGIFPIWGMWTCQDWIRASNEFQAAVKTLKGVPPFLGMDSIHGAAFIHGATVFPQPIGQAATWNTSMIHEVNIITAKDMRTCGLNWAFAPSADIGMQPLWGRHWETFGDEPALVSAMVRASITGLQRTDLATEDFQYNTPSTNYTMILACIKHWIGYSLPDNGVDRQMATIPSWMMERYCLPPFRAGFEAGAQSLMLNSGAVNGKPGHAIPELMTTLLRDVMKWDGFVTSDYNDIDALVYRGNWFPDIRAASKGAYLAGMDMSMQSPAFHTILYDLVQAKEVPESRIEQTATRILRAKNTVGLFENPFPFPNNAKTVGSAADKAFSVNVIEDSVTLLKNRDSVLPIEIKQGSPKRILVTGPCGNSLKFQSGAWTVNWQGADDGAFPPGGSTLFRGIKTYADKFGWTTDYIEGSNMEAPTTMAEAVARAQSVDYVVVCLGERNYAEGYYNIGDLTLQAAQLDLAAALARVNKNVVLVLCQGRPRLFTRVLDSVAAVLYAYLPGPNAGTAIANILFGDANPSGKLPFAYPSKPTGGLSQQYNNNRENLFELGFGLSYTSYEYTDLIVKPESFVYAPGATLSISVVVKNIGKVAGKEVVQLYIGELFDHVEGKVESHWLLRRFLKITLQPEEVKQVTFTLRDADFRYILGGKTPPSTLERTVPVRIGLELQTSFAFSATETEYPRFSIAVPDLPADDGKEEPFVLKPPVDPPADPPVEPPVAPPQIPPANPPEDSPASDTPLSPPFRYVSPAELVFPSEEPQPARSPAGGFRFVASLSIAFSVLLYVIGEQLLCCT